MTESEEVTSDPTLRSPFNPNRDRFGDLIPSVAKQNNLTRKATKAAYKLQHELSLPVTPNVRRLVSKQLRRELGRRPTKREVNTKLREFLAWVKSVENEAAGNAPEDFGAAPVAPETLSI